MKLPGDVDWNGTAHLAEKNVVLIFLPWIKCFLICFFTCSLPRMDYSQCCWQRIYVYIPGLLWCKYSFTVLTYYTNECTFI